jgi:hypothetical protein
MFNLNPHKYCLEDLGRADQEGAASLERVWSARSETLNSVLGLQRYVLARGPLQSGENDEVFDISCHDPTLL